MWHLCKSCPPRTISKMRRLCGFLKSMTSEYETFTKNNILLSPCVARVTGSSIVTVTKAVRRLSDFLAARVSYEAYSTRESKQHSHLKISVIYKAGLPRHHGTLFKTRDRAQAGRGTRFRQSDPPSSPIIDRNVLLKTIQVDTTH